MSKKLDIGDIDIDIPSSFNPKTAFPQIVQGSMVLNKTLKKHISGYYLQNIPVDKVTNLAAIPYKDADELGYYKIDFLHLNILSLFKNKKEIRELIHKEPNWELLQDPKNVKKLFQINKHYDIIKRIKPTSIIELADCVAAIRPGKKELIDKYLSDREANRYILYRGRDESKSAYKKSHAIAYATIIALQLHLISQNRL